MNRTKPYCWVKCNKTEYVHQVIDGIKQSQFTSVLVGHTAPSTGIKMHSLLNSVNSFRS